MICPEAARSLQLPDAQEWYPMTRSWGMNVTDWNLGLQDIAYRFSSEIPSPDQKLLFADATDWWIIEWWSNVYAGEYDTIMAAAYRHENHIHIGFFDGHVEAQPREQVVFNDTLWKPME
jgi:prepilin-type processing-associated H-X9-DG protein